MRIVMEQGGHAFKNMGDWAMLQVAVQRFKKLFPGCDIAVLCDDPSRVPECVRGATGVPTRGRDMVLRSGSLLGRLSSGFAHLDQAVVRMYPRVALPLVLHRYRSCGWDHEPVESFVTAIQQADVVIATGGGYICDQFPHMVEGVCGVLRIAQGLGKPTAMLSQGLGPLTQNLRRTASQSLKSLQLLTVREGLRSPNVAVRLGVRADRIVVSGDDAIELAYQNRPPQFGKNLGVNIRVTDYSSVGQSHLAAIRLTLQKLLKNFDTLPVVLPISYYNEQEDLRMTLDLLGEVTRTASKTTTLPTDVVQLTGKCRLVITGSYHAAVFALAQGIPAIGLAGSTYYRDKFAGLEAQFGHGCACLNLNETKLTEKLEQTAKRFWDSADSLRKELLERAEDQINSGWTAYQRFAGEIGNQCT